MRDLLEQAAEAVESARDAPVSRDGRARLDQFATHLQSRADRDVTPALGTLDRVQTNLREFEAEADEPSVADARADARDHLLSFLGPLDDRGMKRHGD